LGIIPITSSPIDIVMRKVSSGNDTLVYLIGEPISWYSASNFGVPPIDVLNYIILTEDGLALLTEDGLELII
jgi:hypothetical protein